jgi:hypothetical protein
VWLEQAFRTAVVYGGGGLSAAALVRQSVRNADCVGDGAYSPCSSGLDVCHMAGPTVTKDDVLQTAGVGGTAGVHVSP